MSVIPDRRRVFPRLFSTVAFLGMVFSTGVANADETYRVVDVESPDVLNVRAGPATGFPIVGTLPPDTGGIERFECANRWCRVQYGDIEGWVAGRFLAPEPEATADSGTSVDSETDVPSTAGGATHAVLPDGTIEIRFPDGSKRQRRPDGRIVRLRSDGTPVNHHSLQAQGADLPPLPAEYEGWGTQVNDKLLGILTNILTPAELTEYQQTETGRSTYDLTNWRIRSIQFLTTPTS